MKPSRSLVAALMLLFALLISACTVEKKDPEQDDLFRAEAALKERDIGDAEMFFERYLRKNTVGDRRWEVWNNLLDISLNMRQDSATASQYLEIMLDEFGDDPAKRRSILIQLAGIANSRHNYPRAVALWEDLAADPQTPAEDRALVYRELSAAYMRRLEFSEARDVLGLCLDLDIAPESKAGCLYALAEIQMLTEALPESEQVLRDLLALEGVAESSRVAAVFMLADVLEQLNRLDEAAQLLESIHESYPNASVVLLRLKALKDKKAAKKEAAPVYKR